MAIVTLQRFLRNRQTAHRQNPIDPLLELISVNIIQEELALHEASILSSMYVPAPDPFSRIDRSEKRCGYTIDRLVKKL
jgi:hypothetical protein